MVVKAILAEVVNGLNGSLYLLKIGGMEENEPLIGMLWSSC